MVLNEIILNEIISTSKRGYWPDKIFEPTPVLSEDPDNIEKEQNFNNKYFCKETKKYNNEPMVIFEEYSNMSWRMNIQNTN